MAEPSRPPKGPGSRGQPDAGPFMDAEGWRGTALRTGGADRPAFEAAAGQCFRHAGIPWHGNVVWVRSPHLVVLAAPMAALLIALGFPESVPGARREVRALARLLLPEGEEELVQAVWRAVRGALEAPGTDVSRDALEGALERTLAGTVASELRCAAGLPCPEQTLRPLRLALHASVRACLARVPHGGSPLQDALLAVIGRAWYQYICGHRRQAFGLLLDDLYGCGDLRERERAYRFAVGGACCWYPHTELLVASEWPAELHMEGGDLERLHRTDGAAVSWPDGWSVHAVHGLHPADRRPGH